MVLHTDLLGEAMQWCVLRKARFSVEKTAGFQKPRADGIIMSFRLYLQSSGRHDSKFVLPLIYFSITLLSHVVSIVFLYAPVRWASFEVETTFWLD